MLGMLVYGLPEILQLRVVKTIKFRGLQVSECIKFVMLVDFCSFFENIPLPHMFQSVQTFNQFFHLGGSPHH